MVRDLRRLADSRFDLIVVGAGFYGAIAAWDAALRGLAVALIDQGDFGGATSFNNLKTLHGGLRSLQSMNFAQMRLFIRERRALARVAPHLVYPIPFVVPTYADPKRSATLMRIALPLNDIVARDRHVGLNDPSLHLPASQVVSREECLRLNPVIDERGVTGGAVWYDYQLHSTDRMTFAFVRSAAERGAVAVNYARADRIIVRDGRVAGVRVEDRLGGQTFDVQAPVVLNAAGPWAASLLTRVDPRLSAPAPKLSRAMNLITGPIVQSHGCGGLAAGRFLFLVPWRHVSMLGTSHDVHRDDPDTLRVTRADVDAFLAEARQAFPRAPLSASDVRLVHRGLLPMVSGDERHVNLLRESTVIDHARDGVHGLVSMFGVRYTTARQTAEKAIDAVFRAAGRHETPRSRTDTTPVFGGDIGMKTAFVERAAGADTAQPPDQLRRIALTYGTAFDDVVQLSRDGSSLAQPLSETCAVTGAEILYAVRHEAAVMLSDALIRRTEAGAAGHPGRDAVERAAQIMGDEGGWTDARRQTEIDEVERFYRLSE